MLHYFGTNLDSAGHYFWKLEGDRFTSRGDLNFRDFPFDPESLIRGLQKGEVTFHRVEGWTILRIEGSCADDRGGTKSVFFVKEDLTNHEMTQRVLSTPIARKLIDKMPFKVKWNRITEP